MQNFDVKQFEKENQTREPPPTLLEVGVLQQPYTDIKRDPRDETCSKNSNTAWITPDDTRVNGAI